MEFGPLFLPNGSIRALLALGIVFGTLGMVARGLTVPEFLAVAFGLVIGLYFRDSQASEAAAAAREQLQQKEDQIKELKANQPTMIQKQ